MITLNERDDRMFRFFFSLRESLRFVSLLPGNTFNSLNGLSVSARKQFSLGMTQLKATSAYNRIEQDEKSRVQGIY